MKKCILLLFTSVLLSDFSYSMELTFDFSEFYGERLIDAVSNGHLKRVSEMIEKAPVIGLDINYQDENGWTPLMVAAGNGYLKIAKYLVEHGANIDLKNKEGQTALDIAIATDQQEIIKYLTEIIAEEMFEKAIKQESYASDPWG